MKIPPGKESCNILDLCPAVWTGHMEEQESEQENIMGSFNAIFACLSVWVCVTADETSTSTED